MSLKSIPVHNINVPNGGPQMPMTIPPDQPIFSSYTGNQVGVGFIPFGTPSDAPFGNKNYGMNFHVVEFNPANGSFMAHDSRW
ncbi:MAG: hypothetical protein Terrestrivirus3_152 [Terrestrivirus sp.]|uniref:Uncharacterized protein n=1 Tax=Terrestrivirus sp. TaxID=2487775 RepID=A0A3G4ZQJ5_9VIRU|nr:MAG: hypothetical protein Terrestrivirus3_152 [Terrestrivirus sp.]